MVAPAPQTDETNERLVQAMLDQVVASLTYELSEEDLAAVRGNVERSVKMAQALRAVPLANADEPDFVFQPYRAEG
jgi:hypothetical protein